MKYTNPIVKLKHKGGAESERGNMVADLDKLIDVYYEISEGFGCFPEEAVALWRYIDFDSALREVAFSRKAKGIESLVF